MTDAEEQKVQDDLLEIKNKVNRIHDVIFVGNGKRSVMERLISLEVRIAMRYGWVPIVTSVVAAIVGAAGLLVAINNAIAGRP